MSRKVFLSYKWEDEKRNLWLEQFATDLSANGLEVFLDQWDVRFGESFSQYMSSGISQADVFLLVITDKSLNSVESNSEGGAIKLEVQIATSLKISNKDFRFIGILREGSRVPTLIVDSRYADFRDDSKYEENLKDLIIDIITPLENKADNNNFRSVDCTKWLGKKNDYYIFSEMKFFKNGKLSWLQETHDLNVTSQNSDKASWEQYGNYIKCFLYDKTVVLTGEIKGPWSPKSNSIPTGTIIDFEYRSGDRRGPNLIMDYEGKLTDEDFELEEWRKFLDKKREEGINSDEIRKLWENYKHRMTT